jgi:phosphomannomutase
MAGGYTFDPVILRQYDIRGVVGETLSAGDATAIGRTLGALVARGGGRFVAVGYDGRLTSPELEAALVEGITASGLVALRIGLGPTPALYFANHLLGADAAVMVTGSHNPPSHNGFKLVLGGKAFWGEDIQRLGEASARGDWVAGDGRAVDVDVMAAYVERLLVGYRARGALGVVWDPGNGAAGDVVTALTAKLPGRHVLLNETIDGTFPAHHPDPTVEANLAQLKAAVAEHKADLGVAFDGDGDRLGVVDGLGRVLWGDQLLAILAAEVLPRHPGAPVLADVKASQVLFDEIERLGGRAVMCATGHSIIKTRMAELDSPLAGEMSGHIFFADRYYGYDDGVYAAVRLLDAVAESGISLAELRDNLPEMFNTPEIRFEAPEERKFAVVGEIKARLAGAKGISVDDTDGVRVSGADGWWLLRASNTQNALVVRCESDTEAGLERLISQVAAQLRESGIEPPDFQG